MDTIPAFGKLSSSVDPSQLSATVEGLLATVASLLVFWGVFDAATATQLLSHVNQLITDTMVLIPLVGAMWGICKTVFGLLRKALVAWQKGNKTASLIQSQPVV